jgi:hypothetical protein
MGCCASKKTVRAIGNHFETNQQLVNALRREGLERCNLLVAIDFTKSNTWQGERTFDKKSLHYLPSHGVGASGEGPGEEGNEGKGRDKSTSPMVYEPVECELPIRRQTTKTVTFRGLSVQQRSQQQEALKALNPYQYILSVAGKPLEDFDDDKIIPVCIFGHSRSSGHPYVKEIGPKGGCHGIDAVLEEYEHAVRTHDLAGNTQFAPIIWWAIDKIQHTMEYNILLIIGDGCINDYEETRKALADAARYPLSIVFIGVGDGSDPDKRDKWDTMRKLDDQPSGAVDNWQSVYLANMSEQLARAEHPDLDLATSILMEIPYQYQYFKQKGLIRG